MASWKTRFAILVSSLMLVSVAKTSVPRSSAAPYVSGDTFRSFANHIYDETNRHIFPSKINAGNIVFVQPERFAEYFRIVHPRIKSPYILISHNSDYDAPGAFAKYLDDPKIIAWFGQNVCDCNHPKMIPIPIGIANRQWPHGSTSTLEECMKLKGKLPRKHLAYVNFSPWTYSKVREAVFRKFSKHPMCYVKLNQPYQTYLRDLAQTKFVICPRGNGHDCHRTWETLYMGAIPLLLKSTFNHKVHEGLPVILLDSWNEVNPKFLEEKWKEMQSKTYDYSRLTSVYWKNLILYYQSEFLNSRQ